MVYIHDHYYQKIILQSSRIIICPHAQESFSTYSEKYSQHVSGFFKVYLYSRDTYGVCLWYVEISSRLQE